MLILEVEVVKIYGFIFEGIFSCIICEVYLSLDVVGMIVVMIMVFIDKGISVNVVVGFYYDYIFVFC